MNRLYTCLAAALLAVSAAFGQSRVYTFTDREAYLAGELCFYSLFCLDGEGHLSGDEAVAYLELVSADGTGAESKAGLIGGRGSGEFRIPANLPTGNYRLVAYTADGELVTGSSRIISVFNSASSARVDGGVEIVANTPENKLPEASSGDFSITVKQQSQKGKDLVLYIANPPADMDLALSVFVEDTMPHEDNASIKAFPVSGGAAQKIGRERENEGEIIRGTLTGKAGYLTEAILSSVDSPADIYIGRSDGLGSVEFNTHNIYGDRELVTELKLREGDNARLELVEPFVRPSAGEMPVLRYGKDITPDLILRKTALLEGKAIKLDTLLRFLPRRESPLLKSGSIKNYHLDDYTRFSTIREICTEFVPELNFSRQGGRWMLRMTKRDATDSRRYTFDNVLVMMDGVVISDHSMLEDFDAMLLEDIDIYTEGVVLGQIPFGGAVNFITRKHYVTALHFPDNVRVIDFKGVSYPLAYLGAVPEGKDLRPLLYWNPSLLLNKGTDVRIPITTPQYSGTFRVVAEGLTSEGLPVRAETWFEVN
ncbi:MAG: hypothetical protein J6W74_04255 [Bacteroidales bacterium]|nr:hypothetical protein [Bacteroidales bacterium]